MPTDQFPSMKAGQLFAVLMRLGYAVVRTTGSHQQLRCAGRPPLNFAFHSGDTIAPGLVRNILCKQVGLDAQEARELLR